MLLPLSSNSVQLTTAAVSGGDVYSASLRLTNGLLTSSGTLCISTNPVSTGFVPFAANSAVAVVITP
jgi:hypothetical protein